MTNLLKRILLSFIPLFILNNGYAYQATDQTAVMAILPAGWETTQMPETSISRNLKYTNTTIKPPAQELILHSTVKKSPQVDFANNAKGLFAGLKERLEQSCSVSELSPATTNTPVPFTQWVSYVDCKTSSGMIVIVDADPVNTYIFIYQIKGSSLAHSDMLKKISEMMKVCYKKNETDADCYFLLSK